MKHRNYKKIVLRRVNPLSKITAIQRPDNPSILLLAACSVLVGAGEEKLS